MSPARDLGPDDATLVARVLADDDRHAFATLVRRHQGAVRSTLRRLTCGDAARADDLAQETFLRAYRGLSSLRGGAKLSAWLVSIAYRTFLDDARASKGKRAEPLDEVRDRPAEGASGGVERRDLERALAALGADERAAVAATLGDGLSHEEAALALGWPLGTLKTRVLHAKQKLRLALAEEER